jgi:hypothetical protein
MILSLLASAGVWIAAVHLPEFGAYHQKKLSSSQCASWIVIFHERQIGFFKTTNTLTPVVAGTPLVWRPAREWGSGQYGRRGTTLPSSCAGLVLASYDPPPVSDPIDWGYKTQSGYFSATVAGAYQVFEESWLLIPAWLPFALALAVSGTVIGFLLDKQPKFAHRKRGFEPVMAVGNPDMAGDTIVRPATPPRPRRPDEVIAGAARSRAHSPGGGPLPLPYPPAPAASRDYN